MFMSAPGARSRNDNDKDEAKEELAASSLAATKADAVLLQKRSKRISKWKWKKNMRTLYKVITISYLFFK